MREHVRFLPFLVCMLVSCAVFAQKNELAVTAGGYFPAGVQTDLSIGGAVEGSVAHRIFSVPLVGIYAELPVAHTFNTGIRAISGNYNATFVTPSVKLKLAPGFIASPYFLAGIGVAHFSASGGTLGPSATFGNTSFAYDVGGGLDVKIFPFVSLRGEVRNFNSGGLGFVLPSVSGRQNNVLVTGGIVLRF